MEIDKHTHFGIFPRKIDHKQWNVPKPHYFIQIQKPVSLFDPSHEYFRCLQAEVRNFSKQLHFFQLEIS